MPNMTSVRIGIVGATGLVGQTMREVLDERLKDYEANPDAGESWDVVRDRFREKLRKP